MTWLLLFALTATLVLMPMVPALAACRRPRDPAPPPAVADPARAAQRRAARVRRALQDGRRQLDLREIVRLPAPWIWEFSAEERRAQRTQRLWHAEGDMMLPRGMHFAAEVVADGHLHSAPHGRHHALWAGRRLVLSARSQVDAWAHADEIDTAAGVRLRGPASAVRRITLAADVAFTHLQAAEIVVLPPAAARPACAEPQALAGGEEWDALTGRALYRQSVDFPAGRQWDGDVVCHGAIGVGAGCVVRGSLKALGELQLGDDVQVSGNVIAEGRVVLGEGCRISGAVISRVSVVLGAGCSVGAPGRPATVAAPQVVLAPGVVVHGTVDAALAGTVAA